jgi:succinate dehydrogenase / fumarate reductase flavoprotein subunit
MQDLVVIDGKARGIIARDLVTGEIERHSAHAVVIASGGYGNVFFLSTYAMVVMQLLLGKSIKGAFFANLLHTNTPYLYPRFRRSPLN